MPPLTNSNMLTGNYAVAWNGQPLGLTEGPVRLRRRLQSMPVQADLYGEMPIDGIYHGGQCFVMVTFKEWSPNTTSAAWPFGGPTLGSDFGAVGAANNPRIGQFISSFAAALVLTADTNSRAASKPATLTAAQAVLAPENDMEILFGTVQRDIPVVFELMPYVDGSSVVRFFALT